MGNVGGCCAAPAADGEGGDAEGRGACAAQVGCGPAALRRSAERDERRGSRGTGSGAVGQRDELCPPPRDAGGVGPAGPGPAASGGASGAREGSLGPCVLCARTSLVAERDGVPLGVLPPCALCGAPDGGRASERDVAVELSSAAAAHAALRAALDAAAEGWGGVSSPAAAHAAAATAFVPPRGSLGSASARPDAGPRCACCRFPLAGPTLQHSDTLQSAAVLACGHVFHADCLEQATPKTRLADPVCLVCGAESPIPGLLSSNSGGQW